MSNKVTILSDRVGNQLPSSLDKLRKHALDNVSHSLAAMFNQADDWLFEKANDSLDPSLQHYYFDVMRLMRLKRTDIEKCFLKQLSSGFLNLGTNATKCTGSEIDELSANLSLVDHAEMEQSVAMASMAAKALGGIELELKMLHARIESVLSESVHQDDNPISPKSICRALSGAINNLDWEIRHKLIFLKLFEKYVLSDLKNTVSSANQCLVDIGVLANLNESNLFQFAQEEPASETELEDVLAKGEEVAHECEEGVTRLGYGRAPVAFDHGLKNLDANVESRPFSPLISQALNSIGYSERLTSAPAIIGSRAVNAKALQLPDLLSLIHSMQVNLDLSASIDKPFDITAQLSGLISQRESDVGPEKASDVDTNIINLVSLLFDFVLTNASLPDRVKAIIARLQIPYLKLAVADPSFLNNPQHSARLLMNELSDAGARLEERKEGQADLVFNEIERVVTTVLEEFVDDVSLFDTLLEGFRLFITKENLRADVISQRTVALEEGKLKSKQAKQDATDSLHGLIADKQLPEPLTLLIDQCWFSYLCWVHHRFGKDSMDWVKALYTVEQMLHCLEPVSTSLESEDRLAVIEELEVSLKAGREAINFNHAQFEPWLSELLNYYRERAKFTEPVTTDHLRAPRIPVALEQPIKVAQLDIRKKAQLPEASQDIQLDENDPGLQKARSLAVGAWFVLKPEVESEESVRCKLAANIKSVDKLIFVNRAGVKVHEATAMVIGQYLNEGRLTALDESQLFDRALENVISGLRSIRENAI